MNGEYCVRKLPACIVAAAGPSAPAALWQHSQDMASTWRYCVINVSTLALPNVPIYDMSMNVRDSEISVWLRSLALSAIIMVSCTCPAGTLYWDGNGSAPPNPSGTGTWDNTTANWNTAPDYSGSWVSWTDAAGQDIAFFPTNAGTVTVSGSVTATAIRVQWTNPAPTCVFTCGTIVLRGEAKIGPSANGNPFINLRIYSELSGTNGVYYYWRQDTTLSGSNTYSGDTTIENYAAHIYVSRAAALPASTILSGGGANQGTLCVEDGVTCVVAGIKGMFALQGESATATPTATLIIDSLSGTNTWTGGTTAREINLVKRGPGSQVFAGVSSRTQYLTVEDGLLILDCATLNSAIASSRSGAGYYSRITLSGGTMRLGRSEQIQDIAAVTMSGGTFDLNGCSESLSNLTIAASSTLDFGPGAATNIYTNIIWTAGMLTVVNWSGRIGSGGGADQFLVLQQPSASVLSHIRFDGAGKRVLALDRGGYYELVPTAGGTVVQIR